MQQILQHNPKVTKDGFQKGTLVLSQYLLLAKKPPKKSKLEKFKFWMYKVFKIYCRFFIFPLTEVNKNSFCNSWVNCRKLGNKWIINFQLFEKLHVCNFEPKNRVLKKAGILRNKTVDDKSVYVHSQLWLTKLLLM